jgi:hypothetical protein
MFRINENLKILTLALKEKKAVGCSKEGFWHFRGVISTFIRNIFGFQQTDFPMLAATLEKFLDNLEKKPIQFIENPFEKANMIDFRDIVEVSEEIISQLNGKEELFLTRNSLLRKLIALKYRLEVENYGWDKNLSKTFHFNFLKNIVSEWKAMNPIIEEEGLTAKEISTVFETSHYEKFVELLMEDKNLQLEFIEWAIRDGNPSEIFIQFPSLQKKIVRTNLSGRIGRLGGRLLKIKKQAKSLGIFEKVVTLPFEGKDISLLDENKLVTFKGNYTLYIKEIFAIFENKNFDVGNLELFTNGVTNWNTHRLAWWDAKKNSYQAIDISKPEWWAQLPVIEILSKREASKKYGWKLNGINWNFATSSTRSSANLDYNNSHSFIEIAVPMSNGTYRILDFGKFATRLPKSFLDGLSYFTHTVSATVAYPDENIFYTHRQYAYQSFEMSPQDGLKMMNSIKNDICYSREGNFVYQIQSDNCAKWTFEKLNEIVNCEAIPNLFKLPLLNSEPGGVIGKLFKLIKMLPESLHVRTLTMLHLPLGAYKGSWILEKGKLVFKALTHHEFWRTGVVYLPAMLHHQQRNGVMPVALKKFVCESAYWIKKLNLNSKLFPLLKTLFSRGVSIKQKCYTDKPIFGIYQTTMGALYKELLHPFG